MSEVVASASGKLTLYAPPQIEGSAEGRGSNPKDLLGVKKVPLSYVPPSAFIYCGLAFAEGGFKYDPYNWRANKVIGSIYFSAALRHMMKYQDGEYTDPESGVPHLGNAMACIAILIDGHETGNLADDRPPPGRAAQLLADFEPVIAHLQRKAVEWRAQVAAAKAEKNSSFDDSHMRPADALEGETYEQYRARKAQKQRGSTRNPLDYNRRGTM